MKELVNYPTARAIRLREIPEEMVRKSFLTCGISNALDSTEDDAIYEEEQGNDAEEDEMDEEFDTESEDEP